MANLSFNGKNSKMCTMLIEIKLNPMNFTLMYLITSVYLKYIDVIKYIVLNTVYHRCTFNEKKVKHVQCSLKSN